MDRRREAGEGHDEFVQIRGEGKGWIRSLRGLLTHDRREGGGMREGEFHQERVGVEGADPEGREVGGTEVAQVERRDLRPRPHGGGRDMSILRVVRHRGDAGFVANDRGAGEVPSHRREQGVDPRRVAPELPDQRPSRLGEDRLGPAHAAQAVGVGVEQQVAHQRLHDHVRVEHDLRVGHAQGRSS